jgi:hypothetical protein
MPNQVSSRIPTVIRIGSKVTERVAVASWIQLNGEPITVWKEVVGFLERYRVWLRAGTSWGHGTRLWLEAEWRDAFGRLVHVPNAKLPNAVLLTAIITQLKRRGYVLAKQEWNITKKTLADLELLKKGVVKGLSPSVAQLYRGALLIERNECKGHMEVIASAREEERANKRRKFVVPPRVVRGELDDVRSLAEQEVAAKRKTRKAPPKSRKLQGVSEKAGTRVPPPKKVRTLRTVATSKGVGVRKKSVVKGKEDEYGVWW